MTNELKQEIKQEKSYDRLVSYNEIDSQEIQWLWYPYIPLGKITILQGNPGVSKSYLTTAITKIIANGEAFPFDNSKVEPSNVILQNGEDGANDTTKPRLEKQNVNMRNVYFIEDTDKDQFTLKKVDELRHYLKTYSPRLIVIDPITLYAGIQDFNTSTEVRKALDPIARLAEEFACAIVLIYHLNKGGGGIAYKTNGSIDSTAIARSILSVIKNPDNEDERLLFHTKCNVAKTGDCIVYKINHNGCIDFIDKRSTLDIDILMNQNLDTKFESAKSFILGCLSNSDIGAEELQNYRLTIGKLTEKTFNSARAKLKDDGFIDSYQKDKKWYWKLADKGRDNSHLDQ